ncbi:MAG: phosphate transport system permease protein [Haloarculaceae archaeon]|jgi:phosphate transport system permease protein
MMSDAYERDIVSADSSTYERVSGGTVVVAFLTMVLGAATLFGWVPIDGSIGGLTTFQLFGVVTLAMGLVVIGLGVVSRLDLFATAPDRFAGLVVGTIFGVLWFVTGGLVGATTLGLGGVAWYTIAPLAGLGMLGLTVLTREDVGTTLPVGLLVTGAGLAVVTGLVSPGWTWSPATLTVTLPAHVVVPLLAVVCSLLSGWTAGKAYNGFGTRGRQTGAYLLISLVVYAVLAVLVLLVLFIAQRGLGAVVENLTVGAASGLLVAAVAVAVVGRRVAKWFDFSTRLDTARTLVGVGTLTGLGGLGAACTVVLVSGDALSYGGVTVAPTTRIGSGVAVLAVAVLLVVAWRLYDGISVLQTRDTVPRRVRIGLLLAGLAGTSLAGAGLFTSVADPIIGLALTPLAAAVAVALAVYPTALLVRRWLADEPVWSGTVGPVPELKLGVTAGLGFLALAVAFELASGLVAVGSPAIPLVGRRVAVAVAAQVVAASFLVYAAVLAIAWLRRENAVEDGEAGVASTGDVQDHAVDQVALAAVGVAGALVVLVGHAIVSFNELSLLGVLTITPFGALDWPFLMNPSQGLGVQTGVMPAIVGTVWLVAGAVVMAVPLAVGAAVYLTEYAEESLLTRAVEIATNGLWSTPSVVFGLFGLAFIVPRFKNTPSLFAGQLVLGFMLLPLVLITSREAMKSVPDEYRDASAALGVSKWETIRSVVIPAAMPGVITGVILGVGRIAGETAPILLVTRGPNFPSRGPNVLGSFDVSVGLQPPFVHVTNPALLDRASALPYQLYAIITAGVGENEAFGWGTALVLLSVVLSFYAVGIISRRYFRRKLDQ